MTSFNPLPLPSSYFIVPPLLSTSNKTLPNQLSKNFNKNSLKSPYNLSENGFYQSFQKNHFISKFFYTKYSIFIEEKIVRYLIIGGFLVYLVIFF